MLRRSRSGRKQNLGILNMKPYKKYCYIVPFTKDFEEKETLHSGVLYNDRSFPRQLPPVCWERLYGWLDGYGILFDPVLQSGMEEVPEFCNGVPETIDPEAFCITSGGDAAREFQSQDLPGLFLCPDNGKPERISQKEQLRTPCGEYFLPADHPCTDAEGNDPAWRIGERSVLLRKGSHLELYFELFFMTAYMGHEFPHKRLLITADMLSAILNGPDSEKTDKFGEEFRLDCQSYGISRMFLLWLLRLMKQDPEQIGKADHHYLESIRLYESGNRSAGEASLKEAFCEMYRLRTKYIPTDLQLTEYPHAGILFPESAFFELEWPEGSRRTITGHLDDAETNGYQTSFELSASDWSQLQTMYPEMISRIKDYWNEGKIELTNGTMSLPYAFLSPMALQYFQFQQGQKTFRSVFGKVPELYQCQENSFTPQMPELLNHFGYKGAIYFSLNHGSPDPEKIPQIQWKSPSGSGIPALACFSTEQYKSGFNFFLTLPIFLLKYKELDSLFLFNFMDLGFVPFREAILRTAKYAPVFGRFVLGSEMLKQKKNNRPGKSYTSDDYHFSAEAFYRNYTNKNALSHMEHLISLSSEFRVLQMLKQIPAETQDEIIRQLCLLEAHDCNRVQGQRPGEFYYRRTNAPSPANRKELSNVLKSIRKQLRSTFDDLYNEAVPEQTETVFNPGEVPLTFAELRHAEKFSGETFDFCSRKYLSGRFAPLKVSAPDKIQNSGMQKISENAGSSGDWKISVHNEQVVVNKGDKSASFTPVDSLHGSFRCESAIFRNDENWLTAEIIFTRRTPEPDIMILEGITTKDSDDLEWTIRYSGRNGFSESDRWNDCLGLEFEITPETGIQNYVPTMLAETKEEKIMSTYCLNLPGKYALLFAGAGNFYRKKEKLLWLLHVANETVWNRKIVLSFQEKTPALRSRGLLSGLYPASCVTEPFADASTGGYSVECQIAPHQWLISNTCGTVQKLELPSGCKIKAMDGTEIKCNTLNPWQLAILTFS